MGRATALGHRSMKIKVIEVRHEYAFGQTERNAPVFQPEIEVEVFTSEDGPGRRIILHPGESVEYFGGCTYVNRPSGVYDLEKAPIR
jgi:hypothetical protein